MTKYLLMELTLFTSEKLRDILVKELEFKGCLPDPRVKNFRMQMIDLICDQQENKGSGVFDVSNLIPKGWTVVEDVALSMFDIGKLKPVSFIKTGESYISGDEMRKRAIELKANLGLADGQRLLAEQGKIPVEFRDFFIPLPGAVLRDSAGKLLVPYLNFCDGRWVMDSFWLDGYWGCLDRFARCE